jgi:stage II sporulation protein D
MRLSPVLLLVLAVSGAAFAQEAPQTAPPPVRVKLASLGSLKQLSVRGPGLRALNAATGEPVTVEGDAVLLKASGKTVQVGETKLPSVRLEAETLTVEAGKIVRSYSGVLLVTADRGQLLPVNECSLESYTQGVLAGECPALFHPEAIRAMAVAVRSYSYRKAFLTAQELCDTTHCQVYRGTGGVRSTIREAVEATTGVTALYDGEVIDAVYSSDCGGYTEANEEAWKGAKPIPYLRPVEDAPEPNGKPFCSVNRSHRWTLTLPRPKLSALFGKAIADLKVAVSDLTQSGRVRRLQLAPPAPQAAAGAAEKPSLLARVFSGEEWRRILGLSALKSLRFEIKETETGIEISGAGWGHGVGLCQFGANGMAREGIPFVEILKHYYSGIEVAAAPDVQEARRRFNEKRLAAREQPKSQ